MKAYFEYEDGSFWAIRTEGNDCLTVQGSKYHELNPENMLKIGIKEYKHFQKLFSAQKTSYTNPAEAELEGQKMAEQKERVPLRRTPSSGVSPLRSIHSCSFLFPGVR